MTNADTIEKDIREIELLDHLQYMMEVEISNHALEETENCYDEENEVILRGLKWSRGDKDYWVVISPLGEIRYTEKTVPNDLLIQMHNVVVDALMDTLKEE